MDVGVKGTDASANLHHVFVVAEPSVIVAAVADNLVVVVHRPLLMMAHGLDKGLGVHH